MTSDTETREPSSTEPIAPHSLLGLRVALSFMAAFSVFCGFWARVAIPGLEYLGDSAPPMDEMHQTAVIVVYAFASPLPIYLLAAIHVGLTRRGGFYLKLSAVGFAPQVLLGLGTQPFLGCIALLPVIIAGVFAAVQADRFDVQQRLANPVSRKLILWPDLAIIPAGVALIVVLIAQADHSEEFVPYEPNPPREFDSSEGWERLESAVADTMPAFEAVENFGGFPEPKYQEHAWCDDGAAYDEEWVDLRITYDLGDLDPNDELSMAYVESLLQSLSEHGYEVTLDDPREDPNSDGLQSYRIEAVRDDGVTVIYDVGHGSADFTVESGCILVDGSV